MSIQELDGAAVLSFDGASPALADTLVFFAPRPVVQHRVHATLKRSLDIVVSLVLIVAFLPVMLVLAAAVLIDNPGPLFFRQERMGRGRKPFRILKFRTMVRDAEARLHADPEMYQMYLDNDHKLPPGEDPRVTRLGGFIRSMSLDELPQLFNVLAGSMSLVGPRPVLQSELERHYGAAAHPVLSVRPGMTGPWQVSGRNDLGYEERVQLDLDYARSWTAHGDIAIMFRTLAPVVKRTGAS